MRVYRVIPAIILMALLSAGADLKQGGAKVVGNAKGYLDPGKGEVLQIHVWPLQPGEIRVRVFTLRGLLVREMKQATLGGAVDIVIFDGKDKSGAYLPGGIYPALVEAPGVRIRLPLGILRK